eukprot:g5937.t3
MEDSKQGNVEARPTCCEQLAKSEVALFCKNLAGCRFAMLCYSLLAFLPVLDILSDLLTAVIFASEGHPWWAGITLGIFYLSGRFTVLFMVLCPIPSLKNLVYVHLPLCWVPAMRRGGKKDQADGPKNAQEEAQLKKMARNWFIQRACDAIERIDRFCSECFGHNLSDNDVILHPSSFCEDIGCACGTLAFLLQLSLVILGLLLAEIVLFPFACLAIIPIGMSSFSLSASYLRAARRVDGSAAAVADSGSSGGSGPAADAELRKRPELFLKTVSIAEALYESLPQLALQVRAGFYGDKLDGWVFILTFSVSALCIAKAIVTFVWNRGEIWATLFDLQGFLGDEYLFV